MSQGPQTVEDSDISRVIEHAEAPFITTEELAEAFDRTREWAQTRLRKLHAEGVVERKETAEGLVIWWLVD